MPKPLPTSVRTVALTLAPLGVLLALAVWSIVFPQSHLLGSTTNSSEANADAGVTEELNVPTDPLLLVPHTARVVLSADLQRLRTSPAIGAWINPPRESGPNAPAVPCELQILAQTQRVLGFASDRTLRDLTAVISTTATAEAVTQCIAHRGEQRTTQSETYRRQSLSLIADTRPAGLLPSGDSQAVVSIGHNLLVIGAAPMVRTLIDRALSNPTVSALNPTLRALEQTLPPSYAVAALAVLSNDDSARVRYPIEALSFALQIEQGIKLSAHIGCGDFDSPRLVADALTTTRTELLGQLRFAAFTRSLQGATVERAAASVTAHAAMSEDDTRTLLLLIRAWIAEGGSPTTLGISDTSVDAGTADAG